ncbi:MAG: hypothetical protein ACREOO_14295 [bacterium]
MSPLRILSALVVICVAPSAAQVQSSHLLHPQTLQSGLIFQHWKTGSRGEELQEIVLPMVFNYTPNERYSISILNTPARASYTTANRSSRLTGFSDTKISTAIVLGEERALLNIGANLPSGIAQLDPQAELPVAEKITNHALAMPMNYFGGGWDVGLSLAVAGEVGKWVIGGALSGVYKGKYVPVDGAGAYRPGAEIGFSLGADRAVGARDRVFGELSYTWYDKDRLDGQKVFQADGRIGASAGGIFIPEPWQISVLLRNQFKRKSPFAFNEALSISYGNELELAAEFARGYGRERAWLIVANLVFHGANEIGLGDAVIGSLGPGWRGRISTPLRIHTLARIAFGEMNDNSIWGIEANFGLVWEF